MPNKKISQLTELVTPVANDLIAIVDTSVFPIETKKIKFSNLNGGSQSGIIAFAGGGQIGATQLTKFKNIIETVVTDLDSAKINLAVENMWQFVLNRCGNGNDIHLYPSAGDAFLGLAINAPLVLADGNGLELYCYEGETGIIRFD